MANAISIKAVFDGVPFIPAGASSMIIKNLEADSPKTMQYHLLAKSDATPGDYSLPIQINYESENGGNLSARELVSHQLNYIT